MEHDCWDDDDNDVMLLMFDAITSAHPTMQFKAKGA